MSGLIDAVFNVELALILNLTTAFILGALLFLIKVPSTEHSRRIGTTKNTIASCFILCAILFYTTLRFSGTAEYEVFSSMMMFVVTFFSSAVLSYSLISLLDENYVESDKYYLNLALVVVLSVVFIRSFWWEKGWQRMTLHGVYIVCFLIQCLSHIFVFRKVYANSLAKIEQYYDEEEDKKIKWVHFCYIVMMLTQMFILVYRLFPSGFMKIYNLWYSLFMLYFAANFISFLGSHKLTLDAFAYKTLSGQEGSLLPVGRKKKDENEHTDATSINQAQIKRLERALDKWVKQKKFSEYDKSREEVARELGTTREFLHMYFTMYKGMDFKTWRTSLRVEEAKRLLLENKELSSNVIGEIAGFSDRSNFHRQFVKFVGCSPTQWRENGGKINV